jgi:hypothetical protein
MRQSIGKGNIRSLLGSPCRQLSESNCPATGNTQGTSVKIYGVRDADVLALQVADPRQIWGVRGFYSLYSNTGGIIGLKPYGRWRISIHLETFFPKVTFDHDHDFLKCYLLKYRTDQDGNTFPNPDLIQKSGHAGIVLDGFPNNSDPTWTWDLTTGPFVFDDYLEIGEEGRFCFIGFDANFVGNDTRTTGDPDYFLGTLSGIQPYNIHNLGGGGDSDPLNLIPGNIFFRPNPIEPPCTPGNWDMPLPPFLQSGAVPVVPDSGEAGTYPVMDATHPGWRASRPCWQATITAQRLSLTCLFSWALSGATGVQFKNLTMTGGNVASYLWDFGDGTTSTTAISPVTHAYPSSGTFIATLKATDALGEVSQFSQIIAIPLKADFSFTTRPSFDHGPGLIVTPTDQSTGSVTWDWDWGDGSAHSTTQLIPVTDHFYHSGHTFNLTLTITDGAGHSASITKQVNT